MRLFTAIVALFLLLPGSASPQTKPSDSPKLDWLPWSDSVFALAKQERRFVLLDLEAVWCHWCHVMDATTYQDPQVVALLRSRYLTVKVDQDSRPDLSNRYEDYGWPATVVFDAEGREIIKRQGYLSPKEMASALQAIIDDPTPGPSVEPEPRINFPANPLLSAELRTELEKNFLGGYDSDQGGWGIVHKYLDWDSVEYSLVLASRGNARAQRMARQTLTAGLNLLDPAWGGVYQYSTGGVWTEPHFEKIMLMQAEDMRIYALAYAQGRDPADLNAALSIHQFLTTFLLSPVGAFYTSQDADLIEGRHSAGYFRLGDAARRKLGVPRVDTHIYARENGWAVAALAALYGSTGDEQFLSEAIRGAQWIQQRRHLPGGGFRHGSRDVAGPYLGDSVAMARAFLALYESTGDRHWLTDAEVPMGYIEKHFKNNHAPGYLTAAVPTDHAYQPRPERDENVMLARVANLLFHYTGNAAYRRMTDVAMRYLAAPPIAQRLPVASVLLVHDEVIRPPLHLTIVGHKDDPGARALFRAALRFPDGYKRLEWWDTREGKLPNPDVQYPELQKPAAFVCTNRTCSPPIFLPDELPEKIARLAGLP